MALVDMSVVEQRYRAVLAVERGEPKLVVAAHCPCVRSVPRWAVRISWFGSLHGKLREPVRQDN